ncbi:MAG TPA: anthranilate synthase component I family protein [Candidatus Lokiarchaeia archaeon]|nr:anthranilate synthase component I family protein [Candidatus Lokiarchaeia archaeon]
MELNINIQKLGNLTDIFEFYKYMNANLESRNHVLLESVADDSRQMLFSFIGVNPDMILEISGENLEVRDVISESGDRFKDMLENKEPDMDEFEMPFEDDVPMNIVALDKLKTIFPITRSALPELFPRKVFSGGLLGYIGYDVVAPYVGYTPSSSSREMFPDALLGFFTTVLAFSHSTKTLYQITNTSGEYTPDPEIYNLFLAFKANDDDGGLRVKIPAFNKPDLLKQDTGFESNTSKDRWATMINETKEHLAAGDIMQAVISRKLINDTAIDSLEVYQALRILNPSAYMFYLNFNGTKGGDIHFIGSSPEALITKSQTTLETVPIAGTRRRGRDARDEEAMANELLHSEKELAEHVMLVDLARNDLARVSMPGTVDTYELFKLKKFPNIMHIISKVRATSYKNPFDILKAMFPAGTVTGAPKKRAMEIIHDLETEDRGPYAGCVGYVSFAGDMDMAISIRTMFNKDDRFIAQAGAGIVVDSKPDEEYLETENKMKGILSTINLATMIREENS